MFNWLTCLLDRICYGKLVTEDYTGKVVRVYWRARIFAGENAMSSSDNLITVLQDDGKYNIAGPVLVKNVYQWAPVNPRTGFLHAHKGSVTVVADSVADYQEARRVRLTHKKWQQSVCSNEAGEVAVVTDYDGTTFFGRTLEGNPWESRTPNCLADSFRSYTERESNV